MSWIYCAKKKKIFWSAGIHFKGSSWQLNAFVIRFFWTKPATLCDSSHAFVSYSRVNYCTTAFLLVFACCACVLNICVCVWARETSAIVELLHPDNWMPDGLKITQCFPILSSFGTTSPGCFDFACVPLERWGSLTATSCHMGLHCSAHNCSLTYWDILKNKTPGKGRLVLSHFLNCTAGGPA